MRLQKLYVDGFGRFRDCTFGPITSPVTVFYGPNEAGKSTLLAFIRAILFGFPPRGRDSHYPPLTGGQHGGRIWLSNAAGDVFIVERFAGVRGGPLSVRTESGEELEATKTLFHLTGNASPALFKNVFAFSLDELQTADLMNDAEVANRVYGASYGVSGLPKFTKSLNDRKRQIFLPTGQQQDVSKCLDELRNVELGLNSIEINAEQYSEHMTAKTVVEQELDNLSVKLGEIHARRTQVDLLIKGWNDWQELLYCEAKLEEMPKFVQFPENPILRLEELQRRVQEAEEDVEHADQQRRQSEEIVSTPVPGQEMLAHATEIEDTRRRRSSFDNSVKDLPDRQGELRALEFDLSGQLHALGKAWDEARLEDPMQVNLGARAALLFQSLLVVVGLAVIAVGFIAGGPALPTGLVIGFGMIAVGSLSLIRGINRRAKTGIAQVKLAQVHDMRHRVDAIVQDIDEFYLCLTPLALAQGESLDVDDYAQWAEVADALINAFDSAREDSARQAAAQQQAQAHRQTLAQLQARLLSVQQDLAALMAEGGTDDPQAFREQARQYSKRSEIEQRKTSLLNSLTTLSGGDATFEAFHSELAASDRDRLDQEAASLAQQIQEQEHERDELQSRRGSIDTQLGQLSGEEESSALRARRNILLEQLKEHAREWSRLTIAEVLVEKTRQKFEKEHQPRVIQHAQGFFSKVSAHRYPSLHVPVGQQTVTVTERTGSAKQPSELSRGTREQLYLALRFGLIREFGERAEQLPVVVDEALVNFDPERARHAAECFAELAQTNQVLVFTCHPTMRDLFATAVGAEVIDIAAGN